MDIWWTLHLKRDPASVPLARRILLGAMAAAGVDPQIAQDLGVALSEACANAVEHGAGGRPGEGFQVTASIGGDRLRIEVTDSGPGLPASALPALPPLPSAVLSAPPSRRPTAPPSRPAAHRHSRRGRAAVPARVLTGHRVRHADRPYDTHVLPSCGPADAVPGLRPVDLDTLPDLTAESGRGLFLIHALTDHVQLRNHPLRGAIVSFDKILRWPDDTLLRSVS
ncbi:ATP-binding protein [Kitasatospora sp. NPDC088351]|uniref:ATP-binding protein n=1 Tax=Kitasatospora sp. NPDC088351 TaxID=3155180 RepID=UPI003443C33F